MTKHESVCGGARASFVAICIILIGTVGKHWMLHEGLYFRGNSYRHTHPTHLLHLPHPHKPTLVDPARIGDASNQFKEQSKREEFASKGATAPQRM